MSAKSNRAAARRVRGHFTRLVADDSHDCTQWALRRVVDAGRELALAHPGRDDRTGLLDDPCPHMLNLVAACIHLARAGVGSEMVTGSPFAPTSRARGGHGTRFMAAALGLGRLMLVGTAEANAADAACLHLLDTGIDDLKRIWQKG